MELVIIQITDLHISGEEDLDVLLSRTKSLVGTIAEVIRKPKETMLIICVTGDIANTGSKEQYTVASLFFDDIIEKLESRYSGELYYQFSFIPGNHDCDFTSKIATARMALIMNKDTDIEDSGTVDICTSIQENFYEFVEEYCKKGLALPLRNDSVFTENIINNKVNPFFIDHQVKLHCLNTAWCSKIKEEKEMKISFPDNIPERDDNDIVITLMHHGKEWFDWSGDKAWDEYHKKYSDIILVGHDHSFSYSQTTNYDETTDFCIRGNQFFSTESPYQSGYNIFKINLDDKIEFFYSYNWEETCYKRVIKSNPKAFTRTKYSDSRIRLKKEVCSNLEEIEIDIISKYKRPLLLSDIYVYPIMQGEKSEKSDKKTFYRGKESILKIMDEKKNIILCGRKESGKSSLLKQLFLEYYNNKMMPVILNVEKLRSADDDELNELIRHAYEEMYDGINPDEVMQLEPNRKVCFIDDFNNIILSDKTQKKALEYLDNQFGIIVLVRNISDNMMSSIKNLETNDFIENNYYELEICELRRSMKNNIMEKWLLLEDPLQDVNSQEFDVKKKKKHEQVQSVIRAGYFSNTPLEYLLVLSYIDNASVMNADYSRYSYIYDCLIRDKINEIANKDTSMCAAYNTLLEVLAYTLYEEGEGKLFNESYLLSSIAKYNEDYAPFLIGTVKVIEKLISGKIIEERNNKYKFKHDYMYYYFVGSYIHNVLSHEEREQKLSEILSDLSLELNYNIALFLAYSLNAEFEILPIANNICKGLLTKYEGFNYEDQQELLSKLKTTIIEKIDVLVPDNSVIPKMQEQKRTEQDEFDEMAELELTPEETEETEKRAEENIDLIFSDFTKLLRLIQYEGDVLKNYSTKIKNEPRHSMIALMGNSNLKLIGFLCEMYSTEIDKIIEIVDKKVKSDSEKQEITKRAFIEMIQEYVGVIWTQFIEINVANLAYCLDCDLIKQDVLWYRQELQSDFSNMVYIEYCMRTATNHLPLADIEKCISGKTKVSDFSQIILKRMIAKYLTNYQYDEADKAKVCEMLGFDYKKIFIEEKRKSYLESKH